MKINNVKPFVLGIGSLVAVSASAALDEADDELLIAQPLADDAVILSSSHGGEGECGEGQCGEDKGDGEGECGEGQCGEEEGEGEDEEEGEDDSEE